METIAQLFNSYDIDLDGLIVANDFKHIINILDIEITNIETNKKYQYCDLIEYIKMHHNSKIINVQNMKNILNENLSEKDIDVIVDEITGNYKSDNINVTQLNDYLNKILIL